MRIIFRIIGILSGAFVGLCLGYFPAVFAACFWLWPQSNLCGLPVALTLAPLGAIVGAVVGWRIAVRYAG